MIARNASHSRTFAGTAHGAAPRIYLLALALAACGSGSEPPSESASPPPALAPVWAAARDRGIEFRAIGQEPGWLLEIDEENSILVAVDYGRDSVRTPVPAPELREGVRVYRAQTEAHTLHVTIEETPCQDTMSGDPFPATVTVVLDGRTYSGCGRVLQ